MPPTLAEPSQPLPRPFDGARAARTFDTLAEAGVQLAPGFRPLLEAAFGNSPFLCRLALRESEFLARLAAEDPQILLAGAKSLALSAANAPDLAAAMAVLRSAKRQAALLIALADIAGLWGIDEITAALSGFADSCVRGALRALLGQAAAAAGMAERDPEALEAACGLVVLAMGKYGAHELNYSSDVDLVVFYDAETFPYRKRGEAREAAIDLVRGLVRLLSETTADGYVFRVDLRLRPDAGATQVAISTEAAEHYYESMGQNWERAAMIKARACAGDPRTAGAFARMIEPFIWRKHLDYAAIEDIHSIKRQIHAHAGHGAIAIAGHNIKLGRGGIREIEFFAQTQQLIAGGRNPSLRASGTLAALAALRDRGLIAAATQADLTESYRFLRHVEHRLQMIDDQQTHTLPKTDEELAHVAGFCGFAGAAAFGAAMRAHLETVQRHYVQLFERSAPLANVKGSLVFTGVEDDPETIETLSRLGYRDPRHVAGAIRAWHHGRVRATRSARARELLTALIPALLEALAATADPDAAFAQFDRFFSRLSAGIQVLSLLQARPELMRLLAAVCGSAPRLADHLARSPAILDALFDPGFLKTLPPPAELRAALEGQLARAGGFEAALDVVRRFAREQIFRVGVQVIEGTANAQAAGPAFSNVAECVIGALLPVVSRELAQAHGLIEGGGFAVIAMGRLGAREMTAGSDLDLVFVYEAPEGAMSGGAKPLPPSSYYIRLAQRLISALTTPTAEGVLYDVDMRLRPSGNKGPVAVSLESFARYHKSEAWVWERMALMRARPVAALPGAFAERVEALLAAAQREPVDEARLLRDAREMRDKLGAQFPGASRWDLKFAPGGLVDIEFIAQTLQLREAPAHPAVLETNTIAALERLAEAGALAPADAQSLISTARIEHALVQILRIAVEGTLDPDAATPGLRTLLAGTAGTKDFATLETYLAAAQARIRAIFDALLPPAA